MNHKHEAEEFLKTYDYQRLFTDPAHNDAFVSIFSKVFNEKPCSYCPDKVSLSIQRLINYTQNPLIMQKANSKYVIKGGVLHSSADNTTYNNHTMTDRIALELITANPNWAKHFDLPTDHEANMEEYQLTLKSETEALLKAKESNQTGTPAKTIATATDLNPATAGTGSEGTAGTGSEGSIATPPATGTAGSESNAGTGDPNSAAGSAAAGKPADETGKKNKKNKNDANQD